MAFFRQYISPLLAVLIFAVALIAVSARIFLPTDMAAPAPIEPAPIEKAGNVAPPAPAPLASLLPNLLSRKLP